MQDTANDSWAGSTRIRIGYDCSRLSGFQAKVPGGQIGHLAGSTNALTGGSRQQAHGQLIQWAIAVYNGGAGMREGEYIEGTQPTLTLGPGTHDQLSPGLTACLIIETAYGRLVLWTRPQHAQHSQILAIDGHVLQQNNRNNYKKS